jgi:hypothetical protein
LELKQVFDQIAEAEKAGLSPEEKKKLEDQAAEKVCAAPPFDPFHTTGVFLSAPIYCGVKNFTYAPSIMRS